mmetsp:Transcript_14498/g.22727  ORF Transcript_14498/g.22727 Transcript_14498/m.22727 type:complete len:422 (-) Transcript_14498:117-1382(-)
MEMIANPLPFCHNSLNHWKGQRLHMVSWCTSARAARWTRCCGSSSGSSRRSTTRRTPTSSTWTSSPTRISSKRWIGTWTFFENTHQLHPVSVSWAGITVVERTLALMQVALEQDPTWGYFVNIGHEDYPAMGQGQMSAWLGRHEVETGGPVNFIKCWDILGHDFFGQWEHHERRVEVVTIDNFVGGTEDTSYTRPRDDLRGIKFYKSLQQTTLHRDFVDYAVYGIESRRILLFMANSKAPDEIFFPTVLQTRPDLAETATCDDTRHFSHWIRPGGSWHPEYLRIEHLKLVLDSGKFFLRKTDGDSAGLLDALDALRGGRALETLGDLVYERVWEDARKEAGIHADQDALDMVAALDRWRAERDEHQIALFKEWLKRRREEYLKNKANKEARTATKASGGAAQSVGSEGLLTFQKPDKKQKH